MNISAFQVKRHKNKKKICRTHHYGKGNGIFQLKAILAAEDAEHINDILMGSVKQN